MAEAVLTRAVAAEALGWALGLADGDAAGAEPVAVSPESLQEPQLLTERSSQGGAD